MKDYDRVANDYFEKTYRWHCGNCGAATIVFVDPAEWHIDGSFCSKHCRFEAKRKLWEAVSKIWDEDGNVRG